MILIYCISLALFISVVMLIAHYLHGMESLTFSFSVIHHYNNPFGMVLFT